AMADDVKESVLGDDSSSSKKEQEKAEITEEATEPDTTEPETEPETTEAQTTAAETVDVPTTKAVIAQDTTPEPVIDTDFRTPYEDKILEYIQSGTVSAIDFSLCDMNQDGIPELIVKAGTCEADYMVSFYTYQNGNVVIIGSGFSGFHNSCYYDRSHGQICFAGGHQGVGSLEWYAFDGTQVTMAGSEYDIPYTDSDSFAQAVAPYGDFAAVDTTYLFDVAMDGNWEVLGYTKSGQFVDSDQPGWDFSMIENYENGF
ncbi:hypothetical protein, partial [uncultured Ruminococcus sp.]